jgi:hypothetical protein
MTNLESSTIRREVGKPFDYDKEKNRVKLLLLGLALAVAAAMIIPLFFM